MQLPQERFYLFGMGRREKYLYLPGRLYSAMDGALLQEWDIIEDAIIPAAYRIEMTLKNGARCVLWEDEQGVMLDEDGHRRRLSSGAVCLPDFAGHPHADLLKSLHQEILVNITPAGPVPNLLVYQKPWYRDAAMMCLVLQKTGNLHLVTDWIGDISEVYDRNNAGHCEPDNIGQVLFMASLANGTAHPIVAKALQAAEKIRKDRHITGLSDFAEHPVYQTKWLKYGLAALHEDDPYDIPAVYDSYSTLFWMDYRDEHVAGPQFDARSCQLYPYLDWAQAHFLHAPYPQLPNANTYPLTWEADASQAKYAGMEIIGGGDNGYAARKISAPHTWHAAEMFLYLYEAQEG